MSTPTPAPASPPPANNTSPPPVTPSAPPPSTPSPPPPSTAPPPATPSPPPPSTAPPPTTPVTPPPPVTPEPTPPTTSPSPPTSRPPPSNSPPPPPPTPSTTTPPSPPVPRSPPAPPSRTPSTPSRSPPPPTTTSLSPPPPSSSSISTGLVVGIAIGGVVILLLLSILCLCCTKKRRRRRDEEDYYMPPPPPPTGSKVDPYGGQPQQWQHNAPPPQPPVIGTMPKPSPPPAVASRPSSLPPPLYMSSSEGSGSMYSGSENPLTPPPPPPPNMAFGFSKSSFTYEELAMATDGFSDANLLGQGGFGYVHRGVLPNGKEVAVKQLKAGSGQGEREFQAEVEIISRVHHKHLVSLVGYCITGSQRLLVYEFVPNNTLEFHLHGKERPTMDWATRLRIALGSAKGLAYLHEDCHPKIIHRDIKAANILLDFKFEAKVADFGLAKFFTSDVNTHVSTRVMGTFGYLAPEYASSGKLTEKSDVFSFGVMLLEFITGRRPVDISNTFMEDSLVDWARPLLNRALDDGNFDTLVDPRMQNNYNHSEMARMVACAAACVRHSARRRPRMSQVVRALEGDASLSDLNEGIRPGHSTVYSSHESSDYDTNQYNEDLRKFRKMALASTDQYGASSEYSGPTSEYGLYPSGSSSEGHNQNTREMEMRAMKKDSQGFSGGS